MESRQPAANGFYPFEEKKLKEIIEKYTDYELNESFPGLLGMILPHAGYTYSGKTQAAGYKILNKTPETFIIIGTEHYKDTDYLAVLHNTEFVLPNGKIKTDDDIIEKLLENENFKVDEEAHRYEHSIEVHLPFIIHFHRNAKIVPILTRCLDLKKLDEAASVIAESSKNKDVFVIVSTDLVHYPDYATAIKIDSITLNSLESFDEVNVLRNEKNVLDETKNIYCSMCGVSAALLGILTMKKMGAKSLKTILYSNSFHAGGDSTRVVGYAVAGFFNREFKSPAYEIERVKDSDVIKFVKSVINEKLGIKSEKPVLKSFMCDGVFITLRKDGRLRGCIGTIEKTDFVEGLKTYSIQSAFYDPRFAAVKKDEVEKLEVEVSILLKPVKVNSIFDVGKFHGVIVKNKTKKGLFLPDVWKEIYNRAVFLTELAFEKAMLEPYMLLEKNTELYIFGVRQIT